MKEKLMIYQTSIWEIYEKYKATLDVSSASNLRSVIVSYFVPGIGGNTPKGKRATNEEMNLGIEHFKQATVEQLENALSIMEGVFDEREIQQNKRRHYRSPMKMFVEQAREWGYFSYESKSQKGEEPQKRRNRRGEGRRPKIRHGQSQKEPFTLMARYSRGLNQGELIYPDDHINPSLNSDLEDFKKWRTPACSAGSLEKEFEQIYQFLGWLHRYKGIPLDELRLTSIVAHYPLELSIDENLELKLESVLLSGENKEAFNNYLLENAITQKVAKAKARKTAQLARDYLDFQGCHPNTRKISLNVWMTVVKFVFREDIGTEDFCEHRDIPAWRQLNKIFNELAKEAKNTLPSVPHKNKSTTWENAWEVLLFLQSLVPDENPQCRYNPDGTIYQKCPARSAANNLQRFLFLALMMVLPPTRSRNYYQLEIGRTFIYGRRAGEDIIPVEKMSSPQDARWYIDLTRDDYKTGKIYGTWNAEVPNNIKFPNGKTLYSYIERWLTWGREVHQKVEHSFFFRGPISYKPLNHKDWYHRIVTIFAERIGIPVTPKELRKMYVTFLKDSGASEAELEGAAWMMQHSRLMQSKIYDQQDKEKKARPAIDFHSQAMVNLSTQHQLTQSSLKDTDKL
jgi:hypothetical protein